MGGDITAGVKPKGAVFDEEAGVKSAGGVFSPISNSSSTDLDDRDDPDAAKTLMAKLHDHFMNRPISDQWVANLKAGVTVALINVPLSIALALAAKCTPLQGVISAFWGGFVAAVVGGSNFNIVGPTGALSGLLANYSSLYGTDFIPWLAIFSGILGVIVWKTGSDKYITIIPAHVEVGFSLGVAFIIGLGQLNNIFGITGVPSHPELRLNLKETFSAIGRTDYFSVIVFSVCWGTYNRLLAKWRNIPWGICLSLLGILLGYLSDNDMLSGMKLPTIRSKYGNIPLTVQANLVMSGDFFEPSDMLTAASSVAFVAVLESIISARIADQMTNTQMDQPLEVLGVSLANIIAGLFGGVPVTAALARTALNIRSGGKSRVAGIICAIATVILSVAGMPLFSYLPMCIVAALLCQVAIGMVDPKHILHFKETDPYSFFMVFVVAALCVLVEPTTGIVIGALFALLRFASRTSIAAAEVAMITKTKAVVNVKLQKRQNAALRQLRDVKDVAIMVWRPTGKLSYVNSSQHLMVMRKLNLEQSVMIVSLNAVFNVDVDASAALETGIQLWKANKKEVVFASVSEKCVRMLNRDHWFSTHKTFADEAEAVQYAWSQIDGQSK